MVTVSLTFTGQGLPDVIRKYIHVRIHNTEPLQSGYQWGRRKCAVYRGVLICMQEWYMGGWEKVSCLERCPGCPYKEGFLPL